MQFSIENEILISGPFLAQKNSAWEWNSQSRMNFSNREWKFQARMKISCVGGNGVFMRSSENDFFRSPGPLRTQVGGASGPRAQTPLPRPLLAPHPPPTTSFLGLVHLLPLFSIGNWTPTERASHPFRHHLLSPGPRRRILKLSETFAKIKEDEREGAP